MENYTNALSMSTIQQFASGNKKVKLDFSKALGDAFNYAKENIGNVLIIGLIMTCLLIVSPWLTAGLYIGLYNERVNGEKLSINALFKGFDHFMPILTYVAITFGIQIAFSIFQQVLGLIAGDSEVMLLIISLVSLVGTVLSYIVSILLFFTVFFIIFAEMKGMDAVKTSMQIAKQNIVSIAIFTIIMGIVSGLGVLACFIGIFFTIPLAMIAMYNGLSDVFGINNTDGDNTDAILDHLV